MFESSDFCDCFDNELWCAKLAYAYMADIFEHLNGVNTGLQGRNENLLSSTDKQLISLQRKINIWKSRIASGNIESFRLFQTNLAKK